MGFFRKRILRPLITIAVIAAPIVLFAKGGFSFTFGTSDDNYSYVLRDGVENGAARVVDIAMLGAHDAFSHLIKTDSPVDPGEAEDSLLRNETLGKFADGVFVRLARAQKSGAEALLSAGVRYFDVRLSYYENDWYIKHGLISGQLSLYLDEMIPFLKENPGEFIVFDLQHVYFTDAVSYDDLFTYLETYEVDGTSLLDFIHYNPLAVALGDLTYDQVTASGTEAGLVVLAKADADASLPYHYERGNGDTAVINIRSLWHETSDTATLLTGIRAEYDYLESTVIFDDIFRVNQAQKTGALGGSDLWDTIFGWSLLDMANNSNDKLVHESDFSTWLEEMPIFMVDFANSAKGDFNQLANEAIIAYNQSL
ncbi:MAG: hypothetical protein WC399_01375 [Bacilli bacterium]|jgi:hypothetical protein